MQLLYSELHPVFGYDPINLQVLEREGWYQHLAIDHGLLQDVGRRRLSESIFGPNYKRAETVVGYPKPAKHMVPAEARGPGGDRAPQTVIWVPIPHDGRVIGAVIYQLYARRQVPTAERALLEQVHAHMGVVVNSAYLNELTRNQAVSLGALNTIARALSATHDEYGVVAALRNALGPLLSIDELELALLSDDGAAPLRLLNFVGGNWSQDELTITAPQYEPVQKVLSSGQPFLTSPRSGSSEPGSAAWIPIKEGGEVSAVLSVRSRVPDAYEQSTLVFLQQVADQVGLALRNAWSYASLEQQAKHLERANALLDAQRRRLESVDVIGRRLASCLDLRSITSTLYRELSAQLVFDLLLLGPVVETSAGPQAEMHVLGLGDEVSGVDLPLSPSGPAHEAYLTGRPVLIPDVQSPTGESRKQSDSDAKLAGRAFLGEVRAEQSLRGAIRSMLWLPIHQGNRVAALLSLQSYQRNAFQGWDVQLLRDVAAHVSLAISTAEHFHTAQRERRRLETLHVLETGVAGAADERQIMEALSRALRESVQSSGLLLVYLDVRGQLTGFVTPAGGSIRALPPKPVEGTAYFQRLASEARTIVEGTPPDLRPGSAAAGWAIEEPHRWLAQVLWVPLFQGDRVVGAVSAQRYEDRPFSRQEVELVESAAPVVGIALRTVRLHRANELALRHSVRIQELAAVAGHNLASVVKSVAEQAGSMLEAAGTTCWAFNEEGRVAAQATAGDSSAARVLKWAVGQEVLGLATSKPLTGVRRRSVWSLVPLHYGQRLVGALGFVLASPAFDELINPPEDFVRTAAVAIENARLVAETWGRIRTLEAVAAFADLDIARPEYARDEMGRLVERALEDAGGRLWLIEGAQLTSIPGDALAERLPVPPDRNAKALRGLAGFTRRQLASKRGLRPEQILGASVVVDGEVVGVLTAEALQPSPTEIRRLLSVLASQIGLVLGRLRLISALDRQAETMEAILRNAPVGVVLESAEGKVVYANPVIERIYSVAAHRLIGHPAEKLLLRTSTSVITEATTPPEGPLEIRLGDKGEKVVQVRRVPIPDSSGHAGGLLTLHEDVTEQRAVLDAKDLMLRAVGHEVRSPAAAMRATIASLLQWDQLMEPRQRRGVLEDAYEQSERLLNLVEAQLIIAKLEAGGFQPTALPVSLKETAMQVERVLSNRYGERVNAVKFQFPAKVAEACCEPVHLEQALTNLIGNALEHAWATGIVVTAHDRGDWLEVSVKDNGRGLPPDRVKTLFRRSPAGQHRARGGLGLGLYLCRLIVERSFGGRLWLEQTGSKGSIFKFTVPAVVIGARASSAGRAEPEERQH
ncbi:MAG: GAF domain-containing protein [Candidatus Dormibacteraeota bacterium]|nr:GAF domain-containing protein [Candidatus Dormibacteraeota bacterium]